MENSLALEILKPEILAEILRTGLLIVGGKGIGKTNAFKVITSEIIKNQPLPIQVKLFDTACNLRWDFEPIFYQTVDEKSRLIYGGNKHILYDIEIIEQGDMQRFINDIIIHDYLNQRKLKIEMKGNLMEWILYGLEETQNSLGRYALIRKEGQKLLKMISEARNYNQSFIIVGQRLADISTSLIERASGYLFGKMTGDNDLSKLRRICGSDIEMDDFVKKLQLGEFIYWNGSSAYQFNCPKYKSGTVPLEWQPEEKDKKIWTWLWGRRLWRNV